MNEAFEQLMRGLQSDRTTAILDRLAQLVGDPPPQGMVLSNQVAAEFFSHGLRNLGTRVFVRANALGWKNGMKPKQLVSKVERLARAGGVNAQTIDWIINPPAAKEPVAPAPKSRRRSDPRPPAPPAL